MHRLLVTLSVLTLACGDPSSEDTTEDTTATTLAPTSATTSQDSSSSSGETSGGSSTGSTTGDATEGSSSGAPTTTTTTSDPTSTTDATTDATTTGGPDNPPMDFNLIFRETVMDCGGCGIWFDWEDDPQNKPRLEITWTMDGQEHTSVFQHGLNGTENAFGYFLENPPPANPSDNFHSILVKMAPARTGLFRADISEIPPDATIEEATLFLHIHSHEGLSNADFTSVLEVYECEGDWNWDEANWSQAANGTPWNQPGGDFGEFIREIRAFEDMHALGYNKGNPDAQFSFTDYAVKLQDER